MKTKDFKKWKIPLYKVFTDKEDLRHISKVITRKMDWALGPEVEEFERKLANYIGIDYCLAFNSGTSAGHAALIAIGVKPNEQVIVPSFTFIATANMALMVNAKPKFVDIEEQTLGIDPTQVEKCITKKTRTILPIHYAGLPCKIDEISIIAKKKKIPLIEDAAESLGAKVGNKMVGTFGEISIFSFAGNKILTTGEGGAIATNSKKLFEKLKLIRSHGRVDKQNYFSSINKPDYISLGYNWRMSSITAALAISQLSKYEKLVSMRRQNAKYIQRRLSKFNQIKFHTEPTNYRHVYQLFSIRLPSSYFRNKLMNFLARKGIMTKVFFHPIHLTSYYKKLKLNKNTKLVNTEKIANEILSLPLYPEMTNSEINYLIDSVSEFFEE